MKNFTITYLERTKKHYDIEYPEHGEMNEVDFFGKKRKVNVVSDNKEEAWVRFVTDLKRLGFKLYTWDSIILDDKVINGIHVAESENPNYLYGYPISDVITEVADNARKSLFED